MALYRPIQAWTFVNLSQEDSVVRTAVWMQLKPSFDMLALEERPEAVRLDQDTYQYIKQFICG